MPETKSTQSEFVRVGKVETQAGNPGSRSENWLSMREGSENHILGRLTKIPAEELTEDGPSYRVTVAVPGESKTSRAPAPPWKKRLKVAPEQSNQHLKKRARCVLRLTPAEVLQQPEAR